MKWFLFERICSEQLQLLPVLSPTDPVIIPLQLSHHRSLSQNVSQNALIWKGPTRILKSHFSVNARGDHSHHLGVVSPRPWPAALSCWDCALQSLAALTDRHSLNSAPSQASKHQQRHFSALELLGLSLTAQADLIPLVTPFGKAAGMQKHWEKPSLKTPNQSWVMAIEQ